MKIVSLFSILIVASFGLSNVLASSAPTISPAPSKSTLFSMGKAGDESQIAVASATTAPSVSPAPSSVESAGQVSAVQGETTSAASSGVRIMAAGIISALASFLVLSL